MSSELFIIAMALALLLSLVISRKRRRFLKLPFSVDLACIAVGVCLLTYLAIANGTDVAATQMPRRVHVFVVDCSRSMLADDHGATRLQRAKNGEQDG